MCGLSHEYKKWTFEVLVIKLEKHKVSYSTLLGQQAESVSAVAHGQLESNVFGVDFHAHMIIILKTC